MSIEILAGFARIFICISRSDLSRCCAPLSPKGKAETSSVGYAATFPKGEGSDLSRRCAPLSPKGKAVTSSVGCAATFPKREGRPLPAAVPTPSPKGKVYLFRRLRRHLPQGGRFRKYYITGENYEFL